MFIALSRRLGAVLSVAGFEWLTSTVGMLDCLTLLSVVSRSNVKFNRKMQHQTFNFSISGHSSK